MVVSIVRNELSYLLISVFWGQWNHLIKHILVNRYLVHSDFNPDCLVEFQIDWLSVPCVLFNLCDFNPALRIGSQKTGNQLSSEGRNKFGYCVISSSNLLVQTWSIRVLKWQVSTNHGEQNYSTGPNVRIQSLVPFASNHFRCSVTGWSTGCLQQFLIFVSIWKPEIYNFESTIKIDE